MISTEIQSLTPYPDINVLLAAWTNAVQASLAGNVVGLYLTGSLTYGDFVRERSDLDLWAVVKRPLLSRDMESIRQMHEQIESRYPVWAKRIECSYVPLEFMPAILPPKSPRPWWGFGVLYPNALYGNEWIMNQYFLLHFGVAMAGPEYKTLVDHVDIKEMQKACARDLVEEWVPKMDDTEWLANSHYQSYLVLNLCRILYTVCHESAGSKKAAARWAKCAFPQWQELIEEAERWRYGIEMSQQEAAKAFTRFAVEKVSAGE